MSDIRKVLSYNDVLLVPAFSGLEHLSDCDISVSYDNATLPFVSKAPIFSAPMDTLGSPALLRYLHDAVGLPVTIHRWFDSVEDQIAFYESCSFVSPEMDVFFAVGQIAKWKEWIDKLLEYRVKTGKNFGICVDMAQGFCKQSFFTCEYIKEQEKQINLMGGNVATRSGFAALQDRGIDFIRVGIGGGYSCSTRIAVGQGLPTLTSIEDVSKVKGQSYVIADGGISNGGSVCKSMVFSDGVMCGKIFAGTSLSNGVKLDLNKEITTDMEECVFVSYSGMASAGAASSLRSTKSFISVEGSSGLVSYEGATSAVVSGLIGNLRSSMAYYTGATNWDEFKRRAKLVEVTSMGFSESLPGFSS